MMEPGILLALKPLNQTGLTRYCQPGHQSPFQNLGMFGAGPHPHARDNVMAFVCYGWM